MSFEFPLDVRWTHIRKYNESYDMMATGGYTAAYYIDHKENVVDIAIAKCHEDDLFCRKTGRDKSLDRLTRYRNGEEIISKDGKPLAYTFTIDNLNEIVANNFSIAVNHLIVNYFDYVTRSGVAENGEKIFGNPNSEAITFDLKIHDISLPFIVEQIHSFIEENNI